MRDIWSGLAAFASCAPQPSPAASLGTPAHSNGAANQGHTSPLELHHCTALQASILKGGLKSSARTRTHRANTKFTAQLLWKALMRHSKGTEWIKSVLPTQILPSLTHHAWQNYKKFIPGSVSFSPWLNEQFLVTDCHRWQMGSGEEQHSAGTAEEGDDALCAPRMHCLPPFPCSWQRSTAAHQLLQGTTQLCSWGGRGEKGKGEREMQNYFSIQMWKSRDMHGYK